MKNILFAAVTVAVLVLGACKALDKLTQFNLEYRTTYDYPANLPPFETDSLQTPEIVTNADREFAINNTHKNLIESVLLKQLTVTVKSPANQSFSFLRSVQVYISAQGLPSKLVAYKYDIGNDAGKVLNLELMDVDLKDYVKKDKINLHITSYTDELVRSNTSVEVYAKFFVDAKILGI